MKTSLRFTSTAVATLLLFVISSSYAHHKAGHSNGNGTGTGNSEKIGICHLNADGSYTLLQLETNAALNHLENHGFEGGGDRVANEEGSCSFTEVVCPVEIAEFISKHEWSKDGSNVNSCSVEGVQPFAESLLVRFQGPQSALFSGIQLDVGSEYITYFDITEEEDQGALIVTDDVAQACLDLVEANRDSVENLCEGYSPYTDDL